MKPVLYAAFPILALGMLFQQSANRTQVTPNQLRTVSGTADVASLRLVGYQTSSGFTNVRLMDGLVVTLATDGVLEIRVPPPQQQTVVESHCTQSGNTWTSDISIPVGRKWIVYRNGILQRSASDYVLSGTTITPTVEWNTADLVTVLAF